MGKLCPTPTTLSVPTADAHRPQARAFTLDLSRHTCLSPNLWNKTLPGISRGFLEGLEFNQRMWRGPLTWECCANVATVLASCQLKFRLAFRKTLSHVRYQVACWVRRCVRSKERERERERERHAQQFHTITTVLPRDKWGRGGERGKWRHRWQCGSVSEITGLR